MVSTRPYRDFLTPSLHRRFTNAALLTLGVCYAEAVWMGQWGIFWQWFPLGKAGLRTLLIFISALSVYILRVAGLHIGARTSVTPWQTFTSHFLEFTWLQTICWYTFSAWFYCEVYIWSASSTSNLHAIDPGKSYERPRLNERPVLLRTMFFLLAANQSLAHIYGDCGRFQLPVDKSGTSPGEDSSAREQAFPLATLRRKAPMIIRNAVSRSLTTIVLGAPAYFLLLRQPVWQWTYSIFKHVFTLPKATRPTTIPPMPVDLMLRFAVQGLLLALLWEFSNAAFDAYVADAPLKKGGYLTDESKDPNGSLLAGLKAKKELPRNFAFWELSLIAHRSSARRAMIYNEIERPGGSAWSQLVMICLGELQTMANRIQDVQTPTTALDAQSSQPAQVQSLPKLGNPLKQDQIFSNPAPPKTTYKTIATNVGTFAKAYGQSPGAHDPVTPQAKKLLTYSKEKIMPRLSDETQKELSPQTWYNQAQGFAAKFMRSPVGVPFRQTAPRQLNAVVLGTPTGSLSTIVDAVTSISKLAVCSIKESMYGQVSSDVANIVRTFTSTIEALENVVQTMSISWTDLDSEGRPRTSRGSSEVDIILAALRQGLTELLNEFGEYADNINLSPAEVRRAKEAVGGKK